VLRQSGEIALVDGHIATHHDTPDEREEDQYDRDFE
jgi:hypothetical protein